MCAVATVVLLSGCAAAYDDDGELFIGGTMMAAPARSADRVPVVIDSDLAPDDLAALAYLMRHPDVEVLAITVPDTGMVTCSGGIDLLADLLGAIDLESVPVACGQTPRGDHGVAFPAAWTAGSLAHSGLDRSTPGPMPPLPRADAATFLARLADRRDGLHVVALGPLTEVAEMLRAHPASYARLGGITSMAGIVDAESHDEDLGVGEWNAGADVDAFAAVVGGPVPVMLVPDDPVPDGRPAGLAAPVVSRLGTDPEFTTPAFWDLATAGAFTTPAAVSIETGTWRVDIEQDRGRLTRIGDGPVRVVTGLDAALLDESYASIFGADLR